MVVVAINEVFKLMNFVEGRNAEETSELSLSLERNLGEVVIHRNVFMFV